MKEVAPEEVAKRQAEKEVFSIIDVREDFEVANGKIPGAIHIPLGQVNERKDELDKTKEHILVCRSGKRSAQAYEQLSAAGYKVNNMVGGMNEWGGRVE